MVKVSHRKAAVELSFTPSRKPSEAIVQSVKEKLKSPQPKMEPLTLEIALDSEMDITLRVPSTLHGQDVNHKLRPTAVSADPKHLLIWVQHVAAAPLGRCVFQSSSCVLWWEEAPVL